MALEKWRNWINLRHVTVLTDHKSLERWYYEELDPPSGPLGRRLRWHQTFSKFNIEVEYVKGKDNEIPDHLSRWAYPASQAYRDISKHGSEKDKEDLKKILEQERREAENGPSYESDGKSAQNVEGEFSPQEEQHLVAPIVSGSGGGDATPQTFSFRDPKLGPKGKHVRPGRKPFRKSPPSREVGPSGGTPEAGEEMKMEMESSLADDENEVSSESSHSGPEEIFPEGEIGGDAPLGTCRKRDWSHWYGNCKRWKDDWEKMHTTEGDFEWPQGIQINNGRMFLDRKLCVPSPVQKEFIRIEHELNGHVGFLRFWKIIGDRFEWYNKGEARKFAEKCQKNVTLVKHVDGPGTS